MTPRRPAPAPVVKLSPKTKLAPAPVQKLSPRTKSPAAGWLHLSTGYPHFCVSQRINTLID